MRIAEELGLHETVLRRWIARYDTLPQTSLDALAAALVAHQRRLDELAEGGGYGFALSEAGPFPTETWQREWIGVESESPESGCLPEGAVQLQ